MEKIVFLLIVALFASNVSGHETDGVVEVSADEKLGSYVPLDIPFLDERGDTVILRELVDKPTVIAPVYLSCTNTCPLLLMGLADVIGKIRLHGGKDYRILAISFDKSDTYLTASEKKNDYLKAINMPFPEDGWRFLTGSTESIRKFTGAVGFQFRQEGEEFSHPVVLIFLSPDGRIVRYLPGTTFLPFEFEMAVTEASEGRAVPLARKALLYCMSYDPGGRRYVFNTLKVAATLVIVSIGSFFIWLVVTGKKYKR
ncbi:MAG: SCO family protein [Nitrospiraceae bacterium]|nr:MAG: SCO family protein [Nitrospiraceae bacterium]